MRWVGDARVTLGIDYDAVGSRVLTSGAVEGVGGVNAAYALANNLAMGELLQYRQNTWDGFGRQKSQNLIEIGSLPSSTSPIGASSNMMDFTYETTMCG